MKKRDRFFKLYTFCYMPYVKMMRSVWHLFTNVLDQLYMSICDKFTNIKTILFQIGNWANETLLFHVVATFYLITLSNKNVARVIISHEKYIYVCIFCLFVILTNNNVRFWSQVKGNIFLILNCKEEMFTYTRSKLLKNSFSWCFVITFSSGHFRAWTYYYSILLCTLL